ncbi:MAG: hypothetical protein GXP30_02045 [Verrucomicrobia bacterium]|nr:hypothetical protein [Verrucomicrobiota bacterium]
MKKHIWLRIVAVAAVVLVTVAGPAQSEEKQKFKFGDLFKKTKPTKTKKTGSKSTEADKKKVDAATKTASSNNSAKPSSTAGTTTSKSKEMSTADRLMELAKQQDLANTDPEALVRQSLVRMRALKERNSSSKKTTPKTVKKPESTNKSKEVAKVTPAKVTPPVNTVKKTVTAGEVKSVPKTAASNRPPSLAPVSAVVATAAVLQREAPPENLQASLVASNVPLPKSLVPEKLKKKKKSDQGGMEITSDAAETDMEANTVTFIGNVELEDPTFNLKCDRLVVFMNSENSNSTSQFKEAIATGAMVIVERMNGKGEKDVGHSRKVVYDGHTGDIVLSGGPPVLQSDGRVVKTEAQDATITLKKDGNHRVDRRGVFTIPVSSKPGEKKKGPNLMPGNLNDISNRRR